MNFLHQICRDAHNRNQFGRLVLVVVETEALADGILAGPQARGGIPRHNRRFMVRGAVGLIKSSTLQQRQVDGLQISRRLRHERDPRPLGRVRDLRMLQFDLLPVCAQSRPIRSNCGVRNPRQFAQARQKLIVETLARIGVFVAAFGQLQRSPSSIASREQTD